MPEAGPAPDVRPRRWIFLVPLAIFLVLAGIFLVRLFSGDASRVPSALIGRPAPQVTLAPLEGLNAAGQPVPGFGAADLATGEVTLVNVWASWCAPCRDEHPLLVELAKDPRIRIFGLNQKDRPENARRFLAALGNPYRAVGVDTNGRASIEWGVYGVPETFVVDGRGIIRYKHIGPLAPDHLPGLRVQLEAAMKPLPAKPLP